MRHVACTACGRPLAASLDRRGICSSCWWKLPEVTRAAYESGQLAVRRVGEIARERVRSVKELGGGRHTRREE